MMHHRQACRLPLLLALAALIGANVIKVRLCTHTHPLTTTGQTQLAPCPNALLLDVYRDTNLTFAATMLRGGQPPPQLVFADKQREANAVTNFLETADPSALNGTIGPITMFLADNTGFVRSLSGTCHAHRDDDNHSSNNTIRWQPCMSSPHTEVQRAFPSLADVQAQLSGPWRAAVALYNILPQGAFSADQLVSLQTVQTALGIVRAEPLELSFERLPDDSVVVSGIGPRTRILYSRVACDGVLHVTTLQLVPAALGVPFPDTNASLYDVDADDANQVWATTSSALLYLAIHTTVHAHHIPLCTCTHTCAYTQLRWGVSMTGPTPAPSTPPSPPPTPPAAPAPMVADAPSQGMPAWAIALVSVAATVVVVAAGGALALCVWRRGNARRQTDMVR